MPRSIRIAIVLVVLGLATACAPLPTNIPLAPEATPYAEPVPSSVRAVNVMGAGGIQPGTPVTAAAGTSANP